jgi:hypothetical protein
MALTLEYSVTNLKVKDEVNAEGVTLPNAVVQTYWKVTGTDENGNTGEWSGATPFSAKNVPSASFTSFESLTEETVVGWIKNVVETEPGYKDHILEQLQREIDSTITTEATLPWAEEEEVPAPVDIDPSEAPE